ENAALLSKEDGITAPYVNDELTSQIPTFSTDNDMVPFRLSVPVVAWNTDLVSDDEVPDTIEGLADPQWKGKLTMDAGAWTWYMAIHDYLADKGWDDDRIQEFFETLVSYSSPQASSIAMTELLSAGEYAAGTSVLTQVIDRTAAKGAPIAWRTADGDYVKPLVVQPEGGVLMANAPHPAAALLLVDFILSDGAQVLHDNKTFINTAIPIEGGPLTGVAEDDFIYLDTNALMDEATRSKWSDAYDALIRGQ
ncbi:extracellular solute-binding protein, partial [Schumannella luteola]